MSETKLVIAFDARIGNLERQLERVSGKLRTVDQAASRSKDALGGLTSKLNGLGSVSAVTSNALKAIGVALGALTLAGVASAIGAVTERISAMVDAAETVGVGVTAFQVWQQALEASGGNADTAASAMNRLGDAIGTANSGGKEAQETFTKWGISFKNLDGSARTTEQAMEDIRTRIRGASSDTEALSIATDFFGRSAGPQMVRAAREGADSFRDFSQEVAAANLTISADNASSIKDLGDAWQRLTQTLKNLWANFVAFIAPAITPVLDWLQRRISDIIDFFSNVAGYIGRVGRALGVLESSPAQAAQRDVMLATQAQAAAAQNLANANIALRNSEAAGTGDAVRGQAQARYAEALRRSTEATDALRAAEARRSGTAPGLPPLPPTSTGAPPGVDPDKARGGARAVREVDTALRDAITTATAFGTSTDDAFSRTVERVTDAGTALGVLRDRLATVSAVAAAGTRPLTDLETQLLRNGESLIAGVTNAENYQRALTQAAGQSAQAWRLMGLSQEEIGTRVNASLDTVIANMIRAGQVSEEAGRRIRAAVGNSPALVAPNSTFSQGFTQSILPRGSVDANGRPIESAPSLDFNLGVGLGKLTGQLGNDLVDTLDAIATKSEDAGKALEELATSFVKNIAKMIVQALALRAVQAIIGGIFGPSTPAPAGVPAVPNVFGGFRMAGGPVSAGMSYIVGERGPEVFTPTGSGRITANGAGAGPQLIINNNAPGVVVTQSQVDERTVIAAVNLSRTEVTRDYQRSMRTGHGPYAEGLSGSFNVRRRL